MKFGSHSIPFRNGDEAKKNFEEGMMSQKKTTNKPRARVGAGQYAYRGKRLHSDWRVRHTINICYRYTIIWCVGIRYYENK